jgi:hypothetical protein
MTVAVPVVDSWDGINRLIYLKAGVADFLPIEDIYHEYRNARKLDESFRPFDALIRADGNIPKGGGKFTPRYVTLLLGTKIVPFDDTVEMYQLGEIITDNPDVDPTVFDTSTLTVAKVIYIQPSEAEIITIAGGSGLDPGQDAILTQLGLDVDDIHKAHFLRRVWDKIAKTITIFEVDKTTPFKVFDTNDDLSDIDPQ